MNVFVVTFRAVFTLLGIGILGFWLIGRKRPPAAILDFLSSLAIDIALPFLVLASLIIDFSPEKFPDWWHLPLWWLGFSVISLVIAILASLIMKREYRPETRMGFFYQNGIFFPLIIITGLFGTDTPYLSSLFVFMALQPSLVFSSYTLFYGNALPSQKFNLKRIINPVLVTTLIGLIVNLVAAKPYIPGFILSILLIVGAMATPLFMLILGGNVYYDYFQSRQGKQQFEIGEIVKFVAVKNLIFPAIFLALLVWVRPEPEIAFIVILQAAVPPITSIPIFAERCGGNRNMAGQFILGSFIFSVISIPLVVFFFNRFFIIPLTYNPKIGR
jgi:predicted permease